MASKRFLDAAKLFSAGRSVAQQHFRIRKEQWDIYTQTSTLAKAVKSQTDRVTVTFGAARELVKRFDDRPGWEEGRERTAAKGTEGHSDLRSAGVANSAQDGNIIPSRGQSESADVDDGTLSALRKRELQRQAERQIPTVSADTQGAGQDTFNERGGTATPELSSLPRTKLPRNVETGPQGSNSASELEINQDVFPAPLMSAKESQADTSLPEGVNTDVFTSPRVSKMLGSRDGSLKNPYAGREKVQSQPLPEMVQASDRWTKERETSKFTVDSPTTATQERNLIDDDVEVKDLAASMVQDAQDQQASASTADVPETRSYEMRESRVPSSRFGRLWQYGGLATSMAFGAVGEGFRRFAGGSKEGSIMLSEGNINRLVAKLSRMRGAALKIGQMMSFQDSNFLPPAINSVLQRVQDSADYMPSSQRDKVLTRNLGQDWRDLFTHFEEKPFAAASIGQVHKATLKSNGKDVAVKIQYPGVRNSIDSDLNNISLLLTASQLLPRGLYLDKTIANARTELSWECDYEREAKAGIRFKDELLGDEQDIFTVPTVYLEASGPDVLTAEFMHGTAVTKIPDLTQEERDWIGTQILRISWRELMEWKFMQTDPNWTNFLYNRATKKLELLDFGASRDFPDKFVEPYVELLIAASRGDRETCRERSIELGYLTGQESTNMLNAHIDSIMVLAEPFKTSAPDVYSFENQTITDRVRSNIKLMLRERLAPPPEETYSLHRKLSGAFLLCARLKSKIQTRQMFQRAVDVWNGRERKIEFPSSS